MGEDRLFPEKTGIPHDFDRCSSKLFDRVADLRLALRQVRLAQHPTLLRLFRHLTKKLFGTGVNCVRGQNKFQHVTAVFLLLVNAPLKAAESVCIEIFPDQSSADIAAHAGSIRGPAGLLMIHMHINKARRSGADHFHASEERCPVGSLHRKPVFDRHAAIKKPLGKVDVIRIVPKKRHVSMRVHIDKAGHDQPARSIDRLEITEVFRGCPPDGSDHAVPDIEVRFLRLQGLPVRKKKRSVRNYVIHFLPFIQ